MSLSLFHLKSTFYSIWNTIDEMIVCNSAEGSWCNICCLP